MRAWTARGRLRLPSSPDEDTRTERAIADARLLAAAVVLLVVWLDPRRAFFSFGGAIAVAAAYAAVAIAIRLRLHAVERPAPRARLLALGVDLLWAAALTGLADSPESPFFLCFVVALLSAAYRWGLPGALCTALAGTALLAGDSVVVRFAIAQDRASAWHTAPLVIRALYLLIFGGLLGYLADEEYMRRTEAVMAGRLLARTRAESAVWEIFESVAAELVHLFSADALLLLFGEVQTGREFLWTAEAAPNQPLRITAAELAAADRDRFRVEAPGDAWFTSIDQRRRGTIVINAAGRRVEPAPLTIPDEWLQRYDVKNCLGVRVAFGDIGQGVVLVFNPRGPRLGAVRMLQRLAGQIAPAIYSVYLLRRLRSRVGALERGRLARELHDGVIQSLIAAGMQLDVLRRSPRQTPEVTRQVGAVHDVIVDQVRELRDLTGQLEPRHIGPQQLLPHLQGLAEKFERETGITVRFLSDVREVTLSPAVCHELSRIVQEALVNVRKHSGASNVVIRFTSERGGPKLIIDNDGRGFDFTGRLSHAELDRARKGPVVLKTRVRAIGGELTIDSDPSQGVRLEITLPPRVVVRRHTA